MINLNYKSISKIIAVLALIVAISSCKKDLEGLEPATYPSIGDVFIDGFSSGLDYASYSPADGADVTAFEVVSDIVYDGDAAMRFAIPDPGNPNGSFAGGSFFVEGGRDLSGFNALTFWMKGSKNALIDLIGFGDELAFGDSKFKASISNVPVNSNWQQYIIPLPDPSVLTMEKGMFWYADGSGNDDDLGYTFWIDEVKFENLGTIAQYRPAIFYGENEEVEAETGQNITIGGLTQTVNTSIGDVTVHASSSYFTFSSSNTSVATVSNEGVAMVLDAGSAVITAKLGETDADGSLTITGVGEAVLPPQSPTQTRSADSVIALWSNDYDERPVDTWNARYEWSTAEEDFVDVDGDDMIRYRDLNFVGIEFANPTIDVSQMTHFHMNIWTPDETAGGEFKVLLADAGPDGMLGTGDDTNDELTFTSPLLQTEEWVTIEVPLSQFAGLTSRTKLVQMVLSGTLPNVFVDNVYFYIAGSSSSGGDCTPLDPSMTAFPIDFENCENFSGVFEAGDGVTGYPNSNPDLNGNASSRVYQLNKVSGAAWYSGIFHIFPSNYDMTDNKVFKMKIWSPKPNVIVRFQIEKEGGGAVTYNKTATVATANTWTELEFDFSDQPLIDGFTVYDKFVIIPDDQDNGPADGSVYYIDDIELTTGSGGGDEPTAAAPAPTHDAANVISVFSDAYTNIGIVDFNPGWGQSGTVDQVSVDGDNTLKYSNFNYQGTVFNMSEDLSAMEYVHIDMWTADATDVKFTPISGTGEFLVGLTPINSGSWTSYDIPVGDFTGVSFNDIFQLKFDGQGGVNPSNIWLDNIYFYKEGAAPTEPTVAAPTPTHDAMDVISVFSDTYTNISVADFNPGWGQSGSASQVSVAGNNTLKYENFNFQGTQFTGSEDLAAMEFVHLDMWTADATVIKFSPISASSGELQVSLTPITSGQWVSYEIPLTDFTTVTFNDIHQLIFNGQDGTNPSNIWLDNIYFYKESGVMNPCDPPSGLATSLPVDFEGCETLTGVFEDGDGVAGYPVANPDMTGNASSKVYQYNKVDGAAWYSGLWHVFQSNYDMTTTQVFKMKVWSSKANAVVRFQIEKEGNQGPIVTYQVDQTVVNANTWTELTFDFSSWPFTTGTDVYDRITIFPDFVDDGPSDGNIFYIDDIQLTN